MTNDPITSVLTIQLSRGDLSYPGFVTNFSPQLLSYWATELLSCWATTELLSLSNWATELLSWNTHTCRLWRRDQGRAAAAAGTVRAGARGGAGGGRLQGVQWYLGACELSIFLLSLCLWLLSGSECILNGNFNVTLYGNWSHFTPSQKQRQKQEENKIWITMLRDKQEALLSMQIFGYWVRKNEAILLRSWYETKCLENTGDILSYWNGKSIWSGNVDLKLLSAILRFQFDNLICDLKFDWW